MKSPFISICIPAYRAERYLPATLESVRAQSFTDWELIVTEDGSRDSTEDIVREFARTVEQPVRYDRHAHNLGLPATRNTGIAAARGEWIALLDSDDVWTTAHLETAATFTTDASIEFIHSGSVLFDSDSGRELEVRAPTPQMIGDFPCSLFNGIYTIQPSSVVMRRRLWEDVGGFDPTFRYVEDREMWIRCARTGARFIYTGLNTCLYRRHASALSRHGVAMALASARVYEKNLDWEAVPRRLRETRAADAWLAAGRIALRSDPASARSFFSRSLRHRALKPAVCAYWLAAAVMNFTRVKAA
ncbi:glycosyltransferase family 2 protein [Opitutus terrae]|uniref:Glycosyl transferase family 2 n=1 Tax=Opitutus terrae (strain DSM 11246 / JCM 15787 / PB90-1) TaxID=452637 RepID=B1ZT75_OPITP|nr:glycosyltransferase [Opitutus terrae]ACB76529.1 glycosyl transferase family 2 [Opitutus terrae PB90-1]